MTLPNCYHCKAQPCTCKDGYSYHQTPNGHVTCHNGFVIAVDVDITASTTDPARHAANRLEQGVLF